MIRAPARVLLLFVVLHPAARATQLPAGFPPLDPETTRLLARAEAQQSAGNPSGALADYTAAIEQAVWPHPKALTDRGLLRLNRGDLEGALADFEKACSLAPRSDLPRALCASTWARLGETKKAFEEYDALVALRPPSLLGYWGRGDLRQDLGDYHGAISDYTAILAGQPIHAKLLVNRGNARLAAGEFPEAIKDYDHAVRLDPKDELAWKNRARARQKLGQLAGAVSDCDEALKLQPHDLSTGVQRAQIKVAAGRADEAIADLNRALERAPHQPALLHSRGRAHRAKGDLAAAIADFTAIITRETAKEGVWFRDRAEARRAAGDTAGAEADQAEVRRVAGLQLLMVVGARDQRGALPLLSGVIDLDPTMAEAHLARGKIHQKFDRRELALADFARALELRPGYPEAISAQAESKRGPPAARQKAGSTAGGASATASADAARQLASARKNEPSLLQRAFLQKQMKGDFAGAHADYGEVIRREPAEASAYLRRGTMALVLERYSEAIADFDRVVELKPLAATVSLALTLRGVARQARGEWEAAVADYDRSFATVADFPAKNRFFRRHLLQRLGRPDRGPSLATIAARVDQAWIKLLGGFLEGTVPEAELLAGIGPGDATTITRRSCGAFYHVGLTHLQKGDRARAREFLQRAVDVDLKLGLASEERLAEYVLARAELARLSAAR